MLIKLLCSLMFLMGFSYGALVFTLRNPGGFAEKLGNIGLNTQGLRKTEQ